MQLTHPMRRIMVLCQEKQEKLLKILRCYTGSRV